MKYQLTIYFDNPVTRWQYRNRPEVPMVPSDVLMRRNFRWEWLAKSYAKEFCAPLQHVLWRIEPVSQ